MPDKKYSVFLSSTFKDLQQIRVEVSLALLKMHCIPEGMELFVADSKNQWQTILETIDRCDYYVVIVGGRYGTIVPSAIASNRDGISFTEMECRYAMEQEIPVLPFLHSSPESLLKGEVEKEGETRKKQKKLRDFRHRLETNNTVAYWGGVGELRAELTAGLSEAVKNIERPGWERRYYNGPIDFRPPFVLPPPDPPGVRPMDELKYA